MGKGLKCDQFKLVIPCRLATGSPNIPSPLAGEGGGEGELKGFSPSPSSTRIKGGDILDTLRSLPQGGSYKHNMVCKLSYKAMERLRGFIISGIVLLVSLALNGSANTGEVNNTKPFRVGERFVFELTWFGINAGWATLEVKEKLNYDGKEVVKVVSTARSNKFVSVFYPVDDRTETLIDSMESYPHRFLFRQREGSYKSDKEIIFDQENYRAVFMKDGKEETFDVSPNVQDALSAFYYLRTLDLKVGSSVYIKIFDNRKNYEAEVQVLKKERIDTPIGSFNTICVKPMLKTEGIFLRKGDVYIWLTDDDRKMPVMMKSSIKIGPITATIIGSDSSSPSPQSSPLRGEGWVRGGKSLINVEEVE